MKREQVDCSHLTSTSPPMCITNAPSGCFTDHRKSNSFSLGVERGEGHTRTWKVCVWQWGCNFLSNTLQWHNMHVISFIYCVNWWCNTTCFFDLCGIVCVLCGSGIMSQPCTLVAICQWGQWRSMSSSLLLSVMVLWESYSSRGQ